MASEITGAFGGPNFFAGSRDADADWFMICLSVVLGFGFLYDFFCGLYCCIPVWVLFFIDYRYKTKSRRVKSQKKEARRLRDRKKAAERRAAKKQRFEKWALQNHQEILKNNPIGVNPNSHLLWPAWHEELEEKRKMHLKRRAAEKQAEAERKQKQRQKLKLKRQKEKETLEKARKKAAEKRAASAKRAKANQERLRVALDTLDKKAVKSKMDLVSKHSKKALLEVTSKYASIRKSGPIDEIKSSTLSRVDAWIEQIDFINNLNDGITKDSPIEDFYAIEQAIENPQEGAISRYSDHPVIRLKIKNLEKRISSRKEKLERKRKEEAFSRTMIQTRDVPNATLNRKEKAWKTADGMCVRCESPSSHMGFYWDVYPELQLVLICYDCASKEEFVHADGPVEQVESDLADDFLRSLGAGKGKK